jgi:DNA repair protein RadC
MANLFYGGELPKKKGSEYYWVTTRLLRESGPWYAATIRSPEDVARIVNEHMDLESADREYLIAIYLSQKNQVNAVQIVSIGSLNASVVHPREVFKTGLLTSAASIILVHNHPSGDPSPSPEDIQTTKRLKKAGDILGIEIIDHVIIGMEQHISMRARGLI